MDGEISLQNQRVPVLNLRRFGGLGDSLAPTANRWIVVFDHSSGPVGLVVDSVNEVLKLKPQPCFLDTTPADSRVQEYVTAVANVDDNRLMLPDFSRLLDDAMMENT
jgi:chemotaxis signal transduction protein